MNADLMNILMDDPSKTEKISQLMKGLSNFSQDTSNGPFQAGMKSNPMEPKKPEYYLQRTMENRNALGRV